MENFWYAGGMPVVLSELKDKLRPANTVAGGDILTYAEGPACDNEDIIRPVNKPLRRAVGKKVLRGNLAPGSTIIRPSSATDVLLEYEWEAYVIENIDDMNDSSEREDLPVTADTLLVLKGCGPMGNPGMPEVGNVSISARLPKEGARDMARVPEARISGTADGTLVLHVSPEAITGSNLALVKTDDRSRLSIRDCAWGVLVSGVVMAERRAERVHDTPQYARGYAKRFVDTQLQADKGAAPNFMADQDPRPTTRESH